MKLFKMLGLAALVALMAMAFVGAGAAMAESTELCKKDENPCATKNIISHVHETTLSGHKAVLLSSTTVECDVLFLGDISAGTVTGHFTYTNCGECTVEEKSGTTSTLKVLRSAHELGSVTGEGEVHVFCFGFIECTYKGEGLSGHALGPLLSEETNGGVILEEQETKKVAGSFLCPKGSKLDILTTPLEATYIVQGGAMACVSRAEGLYKNNGGGGVCIEDVGLGNGSWELVNLG